VLSLDSYEPGFFSETHVGIAQLLSALLVYVKRGTESEGVTPLSIEIGNALSKVNYPRGFFHLSILLISDHTLRLLGKMVKRKFQGEVLGSDSPLF
jgi:hypothetical protein